MFFNLWKDRHKIEQESKDNNNNNGKVEIEMVDNNKSIKLKQWIQNLVDKLENKEQKTEKEKEKEKRKERNVDPLNSTQTRLTNICNLNPKQFGNPMKLMKLIQIKDISELEGHKKVVLDKQEHSDSCKLNRYLKNFPDK